MGSYFHLISQLFFRNVVFVDTWFIFSVFCPRDSSESHTGPVWQLKWLEQDGNTAEDDKRERLISVSADGRLTKWLVQKELDCTGKHFPLQLFCTGLIPGIAFARFYFR